MKEIVINHNGEVYTGFKQPPLSDKKYLTKKDNCFDNLIDFDKLEVEYSEQKRIKKEKKHDNTDGYYRDCGKGTIPNKHLKTMFKDLTKNKKKRFIISSAMQKLEMVKTRDNLINTLNFLIEGYMIPASTNEYDDEIKNEYARARIMEMKAENVDYILRSLEEYPELTLSTMIKGIIDNYQKIYIESLSEHKLLESEIIKLTTSNMDEVFTHINEKFIGTSKETGLYNYCCKKVGSILDDTYINTHSFHLCSDCDPDIFLSCPKILDNRFKKDHYDFIDESLIVKDTETNEIDSYVVQKCKRFKNSTR